MAGSDMNRMGSNHGVGDSRRWYPIAFRGGQLIGRVTDGGDSRELAVRRNPLPKVRLNGRQLSDLGAAAAASLGKAEQHVDD